MSFERRSTKPAKLLFVDNNPAFLLSHRLPVAIAAKNAGYDVHCACPDGPAMQSLRKHGLTCHPIRLSRSGKNPIHELGSLYSLIKLYRRLRPDIVHHITIKPVLYGGIAAWLTSVPAVVYAVSGLGYVFISEKRRDKWLRILVGALYRLALLPSNKIVIFQNPSDRAVIQRLARFPDRQLAMIQGSGVDLEVFAPREPAEKAPATICIVFAARLLLDKGIREFLEAAEIVQSRLTSGDAKLQFVIAGEPDSGNPAAISEAELARWQAHPGLIFRGHVQDMAVMLRVADIFVLPSYREGFPKAVAEAAASGLAIVTSDVPGCRDAVDGGNCGLLVPVRQAKPVAEAILRLLRDERLRRELGAKARQFAEQSLSLRSVVSQHLDIYAKLQSTAPHSDESCRPE